MRRDVQEEPLRAASRGSRGASFALRATFASLALRATFASLALLGLGAASLSTACSASRSEAAYRASVPVDLQPAYALFAKRCSKCHSLSRPLDSGIEDDAYWALYVRRMRLHPGSGISERDEATILEFLRYYAKERRERHAPKGSSPALPVDAGPDGDAEP